MDIKIAALVKELFDVEADVRLTRPDAQFGDYTTNIALQLAGQLDRKPREIADEIAAKLHETNGFAAVQVAGPGFINITVKDEILRTELTKILEQGIEYGKPNGYNGKVVITEYSDPNPFKPLHAGHLYTTLVGDSISRLIEKAGGKVTRLNYGGDVGLHVGKSMWSIIKCFEGEYPEKLDTIPEAERPTWLGTRYVEGNNAYEDDEVAKREIITTNKRVYQLHTDNDHSSSFAQIYWTCRQWSYEYFAILYQQLQIQPFERYVPESEVTQLGFDTVKEQLAKGVYKNSQGAVVFEGEPFGLHTRVFINSEGLPTYEAKDVGLIQVKWHDYHFDESIVITANEQAQYYEVMLKSVEQFEPEIATRSKHLTHGVVKLAGGVKMSSRKGNIVSALDIIDAAHQAGQESGRDMSEETILAAIKYAFAKNRIGGDIIYDPKESIALEGNSGPYLQYAFARAASIARKLVGNDHEHSTSLSDDYDPYERLLLRKLTEYSETLQSAVDELAPHHICTYLYELAQTFNRFYEKSRVIGDDREAVRVQLVRAYVCVLRSGLTVLGISTPDKI